MQKRYFYIFIFTVAIITGCFGQEVDPGPGYHMMMINNPALSGSEGEGVVRLSYLNYYPGNSYNLHSVSISYDSYFPAIHGGAALYLIDDYLGGIINDFRGGFSYAYFLQAGKDLIINAGLSASIYHRGYNFDKAILPDQIDPLGGVTYPSSEALAMQGKTVFDIGAGFIFIAGKVSGGLSVGHLAEPDLSNEGNLPEKLKRKLTAYTTGDIDLSKALNLKIRPIGFFSLQGGSFSAGGGTVFETKYLSVNTILLGDSGKNLNLQTGFSLKTGRICIYYNYRFNISSGNSLMPLSLLHQAGLAFSLNNVEKRNTIETINFPKL
jgi:type IX secretion system PorP/SprF family membrane protein